MSIRPRKVGTGRKASLAQWPSGPWSCPSVLGPPRCSPAFLGRNAQAARPLGL